MYVQFHVTAALGRLGHGNTANIRTPKIVEALSGKSVKMVSSCNKAELQPTCTMSLSCASHTDTCICTYVYTL